MSCDCERPKKTNECVFTQGDPRIFRLKPCVQSNMPSLDVRTNMIRDACSIVHQERKSAFLQNWCDPCFAYEDDGTEMPAYAREECTVSTCKVTTHNETGLGQVRANDGGRLQGYDVIYYPINGETVDGKYAAVGAFKAL